MAFMRIAIVKLSALGDIIHAMIVLQFIKKSNKEISIDWIVEESYKDLLKCHRDINQVHEVNLRRAKNQKSILMLLGELRKVSNLGPYDLVIDLQGLLKSALISKLIPANKTIGFDKESIRENFASLFYSHKYNIPYSKNVIERNIALIEFALEIKVSKNQVQQKVPLLFARKYQLNVETPDIKKNILLIPGASQISKCYPVTKIIELTKSIDANFFVSWGTESERLLAKEIKAGSKNVMILEKMQLDILVSVVNQVDLVIGPDTGPTHLAWALNVPSITLFGPTSGNRNTYITKINKIIESESKVNPRKINKSDFSIKNISVKDISELAIQLI
jgi:heptosyltransferase I